MRVEVAVENRVARGPVTVTGTAVHELIGMARTRHDFLGVEVVRIVVVRVEQPLLVVQVENMLFERAGMRVANLRVVADVGGVHVGRVFLVERVVALDRTVRQVRIAPAGVLRHRACRRDVRRVAALDTRVGGRVDEQCRIADRRGRQEEFFVSAVRAVMHRACVQAVRDDLGTDAAGTVVDHELVLDAGQREAEHGIVVPAREYLRVGLFVMELRRELAERLDAVRELRVVQADALERVRAIRRRRSWRTITDAAPAAVLIRARDDRIDVAVHELAARSQHIEYRETRLALGNPGLDVRVRGFVVNDRLATTVTGDAVHANGISIRVKIAVAFHMTDRREAHFFLGDLAAIDASALWLHVQCAEHADRRVAAAGFAAELCAVAVEDEGTFGRRVQLVRDAGVRADEAARGFVRATVVAGILAGMVGA